uniref:Methyltransferase type 11 domain-containing protein n=1 Tax=Proboscia inermis TaxID=420281 RepID=A0A7S0GD31_9STRA|mmetsp:Transcript_20962/g.21272  ORF Transcript_20962/g.21272 Transcript_20962/m.21272 type:complete len:112 (+) Transcript_20962:211-546(+)
MVPELESAKIGWGQMLGNDISSDLERVALENYGGRVRFVASGNVEFEDELKFDSVFFCLNRHDLPDLTEALNKTATLVKSMGQIVIAHLRDASHVLTQPHSQKFEGHGHGY